MPNDEKGQRVGKGPAWERRAELLAKRTRAPHAEGRKAKSRTAQPARKALARPPALEARDVVVKYPQHVGAMPPALMTKGIVKETAQFAGASGGTYEQRQEETVARLEQFLKKGKP